MICTLSQHNMFKHANQVHAKNCIHRVTIKITKNKSFSNKTYYQLKVQGQGLVICNVCE